jgi:hypothetical protein
MPICKNCNSRFPNILKIGNKVRNIGKRKYCLTCSPFGSHNRKQIHLLEEKHKWRHRLKECKSCGKEFVNHKSSKCPTCNFRSRSKIRLKFIYDIIGTACWKCGYDKGLEGRSVLELHHIDPSKKLFNVSCREMTALQLERVLEELQKCCLLCCRCHREYHCGLISDEEINTIYSNKWKELSSVIQSAESCTHKASVDSSILS